MTLLGDHDLACTTPDGGRGAHLLSAAGRTASSSVIRDLLDWTRRPGMLSLAGGLPAAELLPVDRLGAAVEAVLTRWGSTALQYGPTDGEAALRELVAPGRADDVVITTGSQQGLDLLARTLIDPGDTVVVEAPSYLGALSAFRAVGARLLAVPGDGDGIDTDRLEAALLGGARPKLVYVVPEFANPTGATLSEARRHRLAALADRHGFVIVEDDPYGRLRFRGPTLSSLAELSPMTVRLGTASKILAPGLRVGWVTLPEWLRGPVVRAKQSVDLHTSTLDQLVIAELLGDRDFLAAHIGRVRRLYAGRATALVAAMAAATPGRFEWRDPDGGMFLWARLAGGADADALLPAALAAGVAYVPGSAFRVDRAVPGGPGPAGDGGGQDRLRLCFATLPEDRLTEAVERLDTAVDTALGATIDRRWCRADDRAAGRDETADR